MNKKDAILRKCNSCHDKHMCQMSRKSREAMHLWCVSLTKVTPNPINTAGVFSK